MIHIEQVMRRLRAAFPTFACGPETVAVYAEKLSNYRPDAVMKAAEACIENLDRFPTVAQIIERLNAPAYFEEYKLPLPDWKQTQHGDGCGVGGELREGLLKGQRWEPWEIQGPSGKRGFPNNLYYRGAAAMRESIQGQLDEHAAKIKQSEGREAAAVSQEAPF